MRHDSADVQRVLFALGWRSNGTPCSAHHDALLFLLDSWRCGGPAAVRCTHTCSRKSLSRHALLVCTLPPRQYPFLDELEDWVTDTRGCAAGVRGDIADSTWRTLRVQQLVAPENGEQRLLTTHPVHGNTRRTDTRPAVLDFVLRAFRSLLFLALQCLRGSKCGGQRVRVQQGCFACFGKSLRLRDNRTVLWMVLLKRTDNVNTST